MTTKINVKNVWMTVLLVVTEILVTLVSTILTDLGLLVPVTLVGTITVLTLFAKPVYTGVPLVPMELNVISVKNPILKEPDYNVYVQLMGSMKTESTDNVLLVYPDVTLVLTEYLAIPVKYQQTPPEMI